MGTQNFDVFLSHNSADKPSVEELARRLVKEGIQPWLDKWNLIPGEPWQQAIEESLNRCDTCAIFIGPGGTGAWQNEEMRAAIDRRVRESKGQFRVIPVLLPGAERDERSRLPTFLVATTWVEFRNTLGDEDAFHRLISGIRGVEPGPARGEAIFEGKCPYRGLEVFDVEHAPFFFGREALTEWLLNEIRPKSNSMKDNRFLGIVGSSGSGKSSLARAGLIATLKKGKLKGSEAWPVVICRPGTDPLEGLAIALAEAINIGKTPSDVLNLKRDLRGNEGMLHLTTRVALRDAPQEQRLALLVDQFEELFTLCDDEKLRQAMINNLLYAASVADGQTIVILTMRADFYGRCADYPALAAALSDHQVLVGPMTEDELIRSIERPAQLSGCEFETGLVELLLKEVIDQPGGLPLLQYALLELWRRRKGRRITQSAYKTIGGVEGALERRAEEVFSRFSDSEKRICRQVFLRLTQAGESTEDTKRRVSMKELMPVKDKQETMEAVVQTLSGADARLITIEGKGTKEEEKIVEVAHEALIRGWKQLRGWLNEDREFLLWRQRLQSSLSDWERTVSDEGVLLRGGLLVEAERWLKERPDDLSKDEQKFIQESLGLREREGKDRERTRRIKIMWLSTGLTIAIVLTLMTVLMWHSSEKQRQVAVKQSKVARSRQLAAQATSQLNEIDLALLLSVEASRIDDTIEARGALLTSLLQKPHFFTFLHGHKDPVSSVAFSPDGKTLASGSWDKTIILWDVEKRQRIGQPLEGHKNDVRSVAFSPDGKTLASGSWDKTIILWDVERRQRIGQPLEGHKDYVYSVAFSPDGKTLASGSGDKTIILWDVEKRQRIGQPLEGHKNSVYSVAFSPDGKTLASGSSDKTIILWDVEKRQRIGQPLEGHKDSVYSVAFSPDGKTLASGSRDKTIILWDVALEIWQLHACITANRNLVYKEWKQYFGGEPYPTTCKDLPIHPSLFK